MGVVQKAIDNLNARVEKESNGKGTLVQGVVSEIVPEPQVSDIGKVLGFVSDDEGAKYAPVAIPVELPAVTAADNGKVLKVVDGVWAAVAEESVG